MSNVYSPAEHAHRQRKVDAILRANQANSKPWTAGQLDALAYDIECDIAAGRTGTHAYTLAERIGDLAGIRAPSAKTLRSVAHRMRTAEREAAADPFDGLERA